jgi:hypothetical protein
VNTLTTPNTALVMGAGDSLGSALASLAPAPAPATFPC